MGIPSEPGGTLLDGLVLLSRKRIGMSKSRATKRILFMIQYFVLQFLEYPSYDSVLLMLLLGDFTFSLIP
jgi:hypothetical protein